MVFAVLQQWSTSCTRAAIGQPFGRRHVQAAGLFAGAVVATAWAPRAQAAVERGIWAEAVDQKTEDKSQGPEPNNLPLGTPPWPQPVDDGLAAVRQRIREYGCRSVEEKLLSLLREFRTKEADYLKSFAEAEAKGNDCMMRIYHSDWKEITEKTELLLADPRKFVKQHGYLYGIEIVGRKKISPPFF